ncbi:MAG: type II toxin-antitoxin system YafQ family toxin [Campylobacteraceae bacterium]|jgi:mRNA interferase YafQ|nr:type II toxin-antitoxin system YafQ family toxin [Campylobacteraceae bacterium]
MKFSIEFTTQYKKDYKKLLKQGYERVKLEKVLDALLEGKSLEARYSDHQPKGIYKDCRECHISPDVLLIYKKEDNILILTCIRLGSHSELF